VRLGGDEFVYFVCNIQSQNTAYLFADSILKQFEKPFVIGDNSLIVTISIGIALFPENGDNIDALVRNADMAMYKVKNSGKNGISFFSQTIKEELLERINIEKYFDKALQNEEFLIYYQPQITTNSSEIDGFEALIRWNSSELGMLSPFKFVRIAEETGFIIPLGEWILRTSCNYIKTLNQLYQKNYKIAVNISVIQLMQDNFVTMIKDILTELAFPPALLELEITESVIMESAEMLRDKFEQLREMGIGIALDDFGTGYSSLAYLKQIPITTLKVDKLFIDDITLSEDGMNLADSIIDIGHKMNLTIVAEGVETPEQVQYLKSSGCDIIQGYYYSKPLNQLSLQEWIEATPQLA
jgi:EAL domain-containing protein (putative c-di-GMP-specific phosphodiesterase class I)